MGMGVDISVKDPLTTHMCMGKRLVWVWYGYTTHMGVVMGVGMGIRLVWVWYGYTTHMGVGMGVGMGVRLIWVWLWV